MELLKGMHLALSNEKVVKGTKMALRRDINAYYRPNSKPLMGVVRDANHYGDLGWFVEFDSDEVGYGYWKQVPDGGELYVTD